MPGLNWLNVAIIVAALGAALVGGVFFAFSNFVMKALARIPSASGIVAMETINITVLNPGFLGIFVGTAVMSSGLAIVALWRWSTRDSILLLIGSGLYVVGSFGVTVGRNVPLNDALARETTTASGPSELRWRAYIDGWTKWNHVRTIASLAAAIAFTLAVQR